ncbi:TFIIB-type zinc ribbon-containing protein [Flavobacterium sp.]|uniref:TFIIB-type zinc ribbon-containing protein n=1 Tax=Flavobacterium sp. TaxID=239 RepID=UPI004034C2A1
MKCPSCNINLIMSERNTVEIDYCPECRGVWLDRGELDKIIERAANAPHSHNGTPVSHDGGRGYSFEASNGYRKKKKDSFLGDLFDL